MAQIAMYRNFKPLAVRARDIMYNVSLNMICCHMLYRQNMVKMQGIYQNANSPHIHKSRICEIARGNDSYVWARAQKTGSSGFQFRTFPQLADLGNRVAAEFDVLLL